jgi:hypothetical protein
MKCKTLIVMVLIVTAVTFMFTHHVGAQLEKPGNEKLVMIWSSADRDVALNMVFMYTSNSKKFGWWDDITLVVWGPSAKLLAEDETLQVHIKNMIDAGVVVKACKMCADSYGVSYKLEQLGIIVKYMKELTDYIKEGRNILTF